MPASLIQQHAIKEFHSGRLQIREFHRCLHRLRRRIKKDQSQPDLVRRGNDLDARREDRSQRALASSEHVDEIVRLTRHAFQTVTRPALQQTFRESLLDLEFVEHRHVLQQLALHRQRAALRADLKYSPIRHHDLQFQDVIRRRAEQPRARPGRIVRDHPAQRRARTRGHIRSEHETFRLEKTVQLIQHHACADAHRPFLRIKICDEPRVTGEIHHHTIADGAADESRSRAARNHRHARLRCALDDGCGLLGIARKRHRHRLDLIV